MYTRKLLKIKHIENRDKVEKFFKPFQIQRYVGYKKWVPSNSTKFYKYVGQK